MGKLKDYKRETLELEVTLPRGLEVCVREFGTPDYWKVYLTSLQRSGMDEDGVRDPARAEYESRARALAEAVVVWIKDGEDLISDKIEIFSILADETYWELARDIISAASATKSFMEGQNSEIKKLSEDTQESLNGGENDLEVIKDIPT